MFKSLAAVSYRVSDLRRAKNWYRPLLGSDPVFDSPLAVIFRAGESALTLIGGGSSQPQNEDPIVAYWSVDDIETAWRRAIESGARPHSEITHAAMLNIRVAKLIDPFGNLIGIMQPHAEVPQRSLDDRPSLSAMGVAFWRARTALDERDEIRGGDHLAEIFLDGDARRPLKDRAAREWAIQHFPGSYEFFLARTAFFDSIVRRTLEENIPQIVFLGAGYDTRAYRFRDVIRDTRIIELDSGPTQERKQQLLERAGISAPPQLSYASTNFTRDNLIQVLTDVGYKTGLRSLFVWEGVMYYLPAAAVNATMSFVKSASAVGSILAFDYLVDAPDMAQRYGVKESMAAMRAVYQAEPVQFRIAAGTIGAFLSERGFSLFEHLGPAQMEQRYLTLRDGALAGRVLASISLAQAAVVD